MGNDVVTCLLRRGPELPSARRSDAADAHPGRRGAVTRSAEASSDRSAVPWLRGAYRAVAPTVGMVADDADTNRRTSASTASRSRRTGTIGGLYPSDHFPVPAELSPGDDGG